MRVLLLNPFDSGSHACWARELAACSRHQMLHWSLPGRHWKWRMHGAAVQFAQRILQEGPDIDLVLADAMLDLAAFAGLVRPALRGIPLLLYFHENQLVYPLSPRDTDRQLQRDHHYAFINLTSSLAADQVCFNSRFHREAFLAALPSFLKRFPDQLPGALVDQIAAKSIVLPLGLDLAGLDVADKGIGQLQSDPPRPGAGADGAQEARVPLILWSHRWEHDKNPQAFFQALYRLQQQGHSFHLAVLGHPGPCPEPVFAEARERLADHILHWGPLAERRDYAAWLWQADILPVTSQQDFFCAPLIEAMYCQTIPLLPRRLVFPEQLPPGTEAHCLYDSDDELVDKLAYLLDKTPEIDRTPFRQAAACYDWGRMIDSYDGEIEAWGTGDGRT